MIEDKKLGLKVATKEEALWIKVKEACELRITQMEDSMVVEKELLKIAEKKIKSTKK